MTEKRFSYNVNKNTIQQDGKFVAYMNCVDGVRIANKLNVLQKENEQLKQRNDRQAKQLDRLYRLIEEKDWRTLTDILDDFKRCEEQLQRESGKYGDLE